MITLPIRTDPRYGQYVQFRGGKVPPLVADVLLAIPSTVRGLTQGGLSSVVPQSAKTHVGLGAFDITIRGMTKAEVWAMCSELLRSGVVAFPRGFTWDSFQGRRLDDIHDGNEHIHAVSWDCYRQLHAQARAQVDEYLHGGDGLVGSKKYTGPKTKLEHWSTSPYNPANRRPRADLFTVRANPGLIATDVDRRRITLVPNGAEVRSVAVCHRWGRNNVVTAGGQYLPIEYLTVKELAA